jgi:hypothetical protein
MKSGSIGTTYKFSFIDSLVITRGIEPEIREAIKARRKQLQLFNKRKKRARARTGRR